MPRVSTLPFPGSKLSEREVKVLKMVAAGLTPVEIAGNLEISIHTVWGDLKFIRARLRTSTNLESVLTAMAKDIIPCPNPKHY